jgi:putative ABC transport system substrate-binding protein
MTTFAFERRTFIALLAGAISWPFVAQAQQPKIKIGMLVPAEPEPFYSVFVGTMKDLGYQDHNVQFEFRSAGGRPADLQRLAKELVDLEVDIIATSQTPAASAAKAATARIPVVMVAGDPVGTGLVASLSRPGGNVTGISATTAEMGAKLLDILRALLPQSRRIGVLANERDPFTKSFFEQIESGARALGFSVHPARVSGAEEFESAFQALAAQGVDAVVLQPSLPRKQAVDAALKYRIPPIAPSRLFPVEGAIMSYSANQTDMYRRSALYADRILKGANPSELPVEQPTKFELVINLKTASLLGITVPTLLLARADELIE